MCGAMIPAFARTSFVQDQTQDGRAFRMLTVVDEFTRQCLAIVTARKLNSDDVLHCLTASSNAGT